MKTANRDKLSLFFKFRDERKVIEGNMQEILDRLFEVANKVYFYQNSANMLGVISDFRIKDSATIIIYTEDSDDIDEDGKPYGHHYEIPLKLVTDQEAFDALEAEYEKVQAERDAERKEVEQALKEKQRFFDEMKERAEFERLKEKYKGDRPILTEKRASEKLDALIDHEIDLVRQSEEMKEVIDALERMQSEVDFNKTLRQLAYHSLMKRVKMNPQSSVARVFDGLFRPMPVEEARKIDEATRPEEFI